MSIDILVKIQFPRLRHQLGVSCQHHAPAALSQGKGPPLHIGLRLAGRHGRSRSCWKGTNLRPCRKSKTEPTVVQRISHSLYWLFHLHVDLLNNPDISWKYWEKSPYPTSCGSADDIRIPYPHTNESSTLILSGTKLKVQHSSPRNPVLYVGRFRVSFSPRRSVMVTDVFHSLP
jgi:hypothetical protein